MVDTKGAAAFAAIAGLMASSLGNEPSRTRARQPIQLSEGKKKASKGKKKRRKVSDKSKRRNRRK